MPAQAIEGGAKYLRQQLDRFGGDPAKALAAYNAGPGAVQRYGGVPPYAETQNYVRKVMALRGRVPAGGPRERLGRRRVRDEPRTATTAAPTVTGPTSVLPYSTT